MDKDLRPAVAGLLNTGEPAHLGPGRREGVLAKAELHASVFDALSGAALPHAQQQLVLALLLLWHDHLEASHTISQGISTVDGSFVHAMMHRREPDYWNSKYWWRHAGQHPAFKELARRAGEHLRSVNRADLGHLLLPRGTWKPDRFVDACAAVADRPANDPEVTLLRELQRMECEVFLDYLLQS